MGTNACKQSHDESIGHSDDEVYVGSGCWKHVVAVASFFSAKSFLSELTILLVDLVSTFCNTNR